MDRLDSMNTVLAVARAGSLSAAGRVLRMPVASVSRKVSDLETWLGVQLFTRTSRRLTPTPAGETYIAACQRILGDIAETERAVTGEYQAPRGNLTVTVPVAFGQMHVLPVMLGFLEAYPEIDLRIHFSERTLNLAEDHIDVAVRIGPLADSRLHARPVGTTRRVICASPGYLSRRGVPTTPGDLAGHDGVTLDTIASLRGWSFVHGGQDLIVPIHNRLVVNTTRAAVDAAVAGIGLVRSLAYQVADEIADGRLVAVLEDFEPEPWPVHLVHVAQGPLPLKVRAFLDWAAPRLKARLS